MPAQLQSTPPDLPIRSWAAAMLFLLAAVCMPGCDSKDGGKALQLTDWLRVSNLTAEIPAAGAPPAPTLRYAIRKPQRIWFIAYDDWPDLDYDMVNVIDDKNILVARSSKYAKTQAAKDGKPADTQVRLLNVHGGAEISLCPSAELINAPANSDFADCVEISKANKLIVKRVDFHGKLLQTTSMAANEWDDLITQKNVAYYDEQQQAYVLETGKDNTYCRLIAPGKEKSLSFTLNLMDTKSKCDDLPTWAAITRKKLSKALSFGELGKHAAIWKKLETSHPGWLPAKNVIQDASEKKASAPPAS
ncbi:hypothetical protein UNDYM_3385 [Undibacterium sp. YM2]|uniref:hypothetical protein n=1 Tax=Undibacterium sp. YM2 TaxID=2058625 RepID=UPI001331DE7D|nr:hypothetical protein [Undibacterium sp. YM2]BBB67638.1 hypothetical protein UNDYM_3385 [Undibacterium sp. YM2]